MSVNYLLSNFHLFILLRMHQNIFGSCRQITSILFDSCRQISYILFDLCRQISYASFKKRFRNLHMLRLHSLHFFSNFCSCFLCDHTCHNNYRFSINYLDCPYLSFFHDSMQPCARICRSTYICLRTG